MPSKGAVLYSLSTPVVLTAGKNAKEGDSVRISSTHLSFTHSVMLKRHRFKMTSFHTLLSKHCLSEQCVILIPSAS